MVDATHAGKVYIETTIPSYLIAWPSRDIVVAAKQQITRDWWKTRKSAFSLYISPYVLDEAARGDTEAANLRLVAIQNILVLAADEEVVRLAEAIVAAGIIPSKAQTDAFHIAVATRHGMDYLLTWNCTHIANAETMRQVSGIMEECGYEIPIICTPDELMGGMTDD